MASPPATAAATDETDGPLSDPLVPIRLNLVVDGKHVQESFTWNSLESSMTPDSFAGILATDLGLPDASRAEIATSIREQVAEFVPPTPRRPGAGESRQVVRLDMRLGRVLIRDQFEWDLAGPGNCPESFAAQLCTELGLGERFVPSVAHAVREQLNHIAEFEDKRPVRPVIDERRAVRGVEEVAEWEPVVQCLSAEEQARLERKEKREARLQRRNRGKADRFGKPVAKVRYSEPTGGRKRSASMLDESGSDQDGGRSGRRTDSRRRRR